MNLYTKNLTEDLQIINYPNIRGSLYKKGLRIERANGIIRSNTITLENALNNMNHINHVQNIRE